MKWKWENRGSRSWQMRGGWQGGWLCNTWWLCWLKWWWWWQLTLNYNTVSCTEDLSGLKRGDISSPSWPASYAENANCQHTLSVEAHLWLELHFSEDFDVEQSPDGQCIDALTVGFESDYVCRPTSWVCVFLKHRTLQRKVQTKVFKLWIW